MRKKKLRADFSQIVKEQNDDFKIKTHFSNSLQDFSKQNKKGLTFLLSFAIMLLRGYTLSRKVCSKLLGCLSLAGLRKSLSLQPLSRKFHVSYQRCSTMPSWVIDRYGKNDVLRLTSNMIFPAIRLPNEVIIKVHAASLNPIDVNMRSK